MTDTARVNTQTPWYRAVMARFYAARLSAPRPVPLKPARPKRKPKAPRHG